VRTRIALLIPTVALAAALTACGDGGPGKADFMAKADAACAPGNTAISTTAKPTNAPQVATAAGTAATSIDSQVGALRALKAPSGKDKAPAQAVITQIADVSAPTRALQDAAGKADDAAMARSTLDMQAKADTAARSAEAYGMTQCGTQLKLGLGNMVDGVKNVMKVTYVSKAVGLCRDFDRKSNAVADPGSSLASLGRYLDQVLPLSDKLVKDLRAIPVPPGDEAAVADYLSAMDALNVKSKEAGAAAKANNPRLLGALAQELEVAGTAATAKLDAYGIRGCGSVAA